MEIDSEIFKKDFIGGTYPNQLDEEGLKAIGQAIVQLLGVKKVVVGHDIRLPHQTMYNGLIQGFLEMGCEVIDCGLITEEHGLFANIHFKADASFLLTVKDEPEEYGLYFYGRESAPFSDYVTISEIERLVYKWQNGESEPDRRMGGFIRYEDIQDEYEDNH